MSSPNHAELRSSLQVLTSYVSGVNLSPLNNSATRVKFESSPSAMFSAPTASTNNLNERVLKMDAVCDGSRVGGAFTYGLFCRWGVVFEG